MNRGKRQVIVSCAVCCLVSALLLICFASAASSAGSIDVDSALIKFSLKQGEYSTKPFTLLGHEQEAVSLVVEGAQGLSLSEDSFFINPGETKSIEARFNSSNLEPGAYVGYISIKSKGTNSILPVVLEVESKDVLFDSNLDIPPLYSQVAPGESVLGQIKMFDLTAGGTKKGLGPASVDVEYTIYRNDGAIIVSESESLVVNHDTGITKSLVVPVNAKEGMYFMVIVLKYGGSVGISSEAFDVSLGAGVKKTGFNFGNLSFSWIAGLVGVIAIIAMFMWFFFLLIRDRDKFMLALRRYHDGEMKKQGEFLMQQKCVLQKKKNFSPEKFKAQYKKKVALLKKKQKERENELRKMRKEGDVSAIEAKLEEWKRKGYNTLLLESKLDELSASDMRKIMKKWKREGYKLV